MDTNIYNSKLSKIKILVMDIDGTLTNSMVYYSANGEELKSFSIRDGMGIELLHLNNIKTAILTSENSKIIVARATKLKIEHIILGSRNKKQDLINLANSLNLELENIAYVGDDVNDLQAMQIAGFSACPSNSVKHIKEIADYISDFRGGEGAVRDICELILLALNKPITLPEQW